MACTKGGFCANPVCETKISYIEYICKIIVPFINLSPAICVAGTFGVTFGSAYLFMPKTNNKTIATSNIKFKYEPANQNSESIFYKVDPAVKMVGDSNLNNIMIANEYTKHIWAKNIAIVDLEKTTNNEINIYYSLCSTKITDGKIGIIKGFNKNIHKINFFCSKNSPNYNEFFINHQKFNNQEFTCIEVRQDTAVCIEKYIDISSSEIGITNKTYIDSVFVDDII